MFKGIKNHVEESESELFKLRIPQLIPQHSENEWMRNFNDNPHFENQFPHFQDFVEELQEEKINNKKLLSVPINLKQTCFQDEILKLPSFSRQISTKKIDPVDYILSDIESLEEFTINFPYKKEDATKMSTEGSEME